MRIPDFHHLEQKLGLSFRNIDLLKQAFTHRSFINENPSWSLFHNERLEFLGDAVLELIVTNYLYNQFPKTPEGELTSYRAALVNSQTLSKIAKRLNFDNFILLSRGETKETGRGRQYILANTFEALIGAIYLDQGFGAASNFVKKFLLPELPKIIETRAYKDPKSLFQERAQEKVGITPSYKVLYEWGPDHAKHFIVGVYLEDEFVAQGEGNSKQEAEIEAAKEGLLVKGW